MPTVMCAGNMDYPSMSGLCVLTMHVKVLAHWMPSMPSSMCRKAFTPEQQADISTMTSANGKCLPEANLCGEAAGVTPAYCCKCAVPTCSHCTKNV
jgi:hypothetical protein